jgi:hypothetical protein
MASKHQVTELVADLLGEIRPDSPSVRPVENKVQSQFSLDSPNSPGQDPDFISWSTLTPEQREAIIPTIEAGQPVRIFSETLLRVGAGEVQEHDKRWYPSWKSGHKEDTPLSRLSDI